MSRLLISAAHTLENPGAIFQDLREADLTRKLLAKCVAHLESSGITFQAVPLDLPLLQRIDWINATGYTKEQGDLFVELHINDGGKRGIESWFSEGASPTNKSQKFAEHLINYVCNNTGYANQGAKSEYDHELTSLLILNSTNPIGTAIECLYIDNSEDIAILKDELKMDELAKILVDGIKEFINNPPKIEEKSETVVANQDINPQPNPLSPFSTGFKPTPIPKPTFPTPASAHTPSFPSGFGGGLGGLGGGNQPGGGSKSLLMDRDQRKEMIKKVYQKILGKDPKQSDENYYLNTGITEEELVKKLVDGEDFKKMIEDAKKTKELNDEVEKLRTEVAALKSNIGDTKAMQESLNRLLEQKNIMISRLYHELVAHNIIQHGEHFESRKTANETKDSSAQGYDSPKTFNRKIFEKLMRIAKL